MIIRELLEKIENTTLRNEAALSINSKGRKTPESSCDLRTCYQQDRDKIIHSKAFRRLGHKTQVFLAPIGDHYTTRLTHTLEVSQIARSIAKALQLNEPLVEAISLGHDLGHTPFGHIGEQVLDQIYSEGFHHVTHSVRIVEFLERYGKGLNLTHEVIDGIKKHSKGRGPIISDSQSLKAETLEGQIVRLADIIAYISHDIEDAIRGGILKLNDIPKEYRKTLGETASERIETMVTNVIASSINREPLEIILSKEMEETVAAMREFMFERVYDNTRAGRSYEKIFNLIEKLYDYYVTHPQDLEDESHMSCAEIGVKRLACDLIAGMTDRFAINMFDKLFVPHSWSVI